MSEYISKSEIPKDDAGNILNYDGTTDCAEYLQFFDAWCEGRRFGGVVSRNNYEQPRVPADSVGRIAAGTPNECDPGIVVIFHKSNAFFLITKCQQLQGIFY